MKNVEPLLRRRINEEEVGARSRPLDTLRLHYGTSGKENAAVRRDRREQAARQRPPLSPPPPRFLFINYLSRTAMTVTANSMNGRAHDMTHSNDDRFIEASKSIFQRTRERENNPLGRANSWPLTHFPIRDILFFYSQTAAKSSRIFATASSAGLCSEEHIIVASCIYHTFVCAISRVERARRARSFEFRLARDKE